MEVISTTADHSHVRLINSDVYQTLSACLWRIVVILIQIVLIEAMRRTATARLINFSAKMTAAVYGQVTDAMEFVIVWIILMKKTAFLARTTISDALVDSVFQVITDAMFTITDNASTEATKLDAIALKISLDVMMDNVSSSLPFAQGLGSAARTRATRSIALVLPTSSNVMTDLAFRSLLAATLQPTTVVMTAVIFSTATTLAEKANFNVRMESVSHKCPDVIHMDTSVVEMEVTAGIAHVTTKQNLPVTGLNVSVFRSGATELKTVRTVLMNRLASMEAALWDFLHASITHIIQQHGVQRQSLSPKVSRVSRLLKRVTATLIVPMGPTKNLVLAALQHSSAVLLETV